MRNKLDFINEVIRILLLVRQGGNAEIMSYWVEESMEELIPYQIEQKIKDCMSSVVEYNRYARADSYSNNDGVKSKQLEQLNEAWLQLSKMLP